MKIAILGSTGFVGSVLLARAIENGYNIRTLVRRAVQLTMEEKMKNGLFRGRC